MANPKRIVLLSDGTGNTVSSLWRTNVWRTFEALDLATSDQVAIYDDGVGTSSFKPLAILGGAFGWGLKRNVLDLYKFVCRNYAADADIYGFGFSRGAFTIRVVNGLIVNQGLVQAGSEAELDRLASAAYRTYRKERYSSILGVERLFRGLRDGMIGAWNTLLRRKAYDRAANTQGVTIRFVGVWDTVAAYGLPVEEMTRGVSKWLWPLELPDRTLSGKVRRACHALAIDDSRTTFHPVLWTEAKEDPAVMASAARTSEERLSQVWFSGVHSNVGGGYPDDRLAYVSLHWMLEEAKACGLVLKTSPDALDRIRAAMDKDGRIYDPRQGLGGYYRYGPRKIAELSDMRLSRRADDAVKIAMPKIHRSALERIEARGLYAPVGLPPSYAVVEYDGRITRGAPGGPETQEQAKARAQTQERAWDFVWARRVAYFLSLAATAYLVLFPALHDAAQADEVSSPLRFVSETIRLAGAFIPGAFDRWIDAFAAHPEKVLLGGAALVSSILAGSAIQGRMADAMRAIWRNPQQQGDPPTDSLVFRLRTSAPYRAALSAMKRHFLPFASAVGIAFVGVVLVNRIAFNVTDSMGLHCKGSATVKDLAYNEEVRIEGFATSALCFPTGRLVIEGERYAVRIEQTSQWKDASIPSGAYGVEIFDMPNVVSQAFMFLALPARRVMMRPWFRPILRIGETGTDEYFLDPPTRGDNGDARQATVAHGVMRARRNGELFLYVNDAGVAFPGTTDALYRNNSGTADVFIKRVSR